jgi:hypothetical protein
LIFVNGGSLIVVFRWLPVQSRGRAIVTARAIETEAVSDGGQLGAQQLRSIPDYLQRNYWWAYVHPSAVRVFERQWLVNFILCGNFALLRDAVLDELGPAIHGRSLQVACVYGDFSAMLAERLAPGSRLDVVDVLPIQLQNLRRAAASMPSTPIIATRRRSLR